MAITTSSPLAPGMTATVERYAVYRCYSDSGQLLYVGVTGSVRRRLSDHLQKAWFTQVRGMTFEWYADELDARTAERRAIHVEHPQYNVLHRNGALPTQPVTRAAKRSRRGPTLTVTERAMRLLDADPSLRGPRMGGELARQLGVSPAHGRRLHARLARLQAVAQ